MKPGDRSYSFESSTNFIIIKDEARKTLHGIHGLEITDMTAKVDPNTGKIAEYRAGVKISFAVEHK